MRNFFADFPFGNILSIIILLAIPAAFLVIFLTIRSRIKVFFKERRKDKELLEKLRIDTIHTDFLSRDDVYVWFDGFLKKNQLRGVLMTENALRAKNNDINNIPSCPAESQVYYLAVYSMDNDTTVRQRFVVSKQTEPELSRLLEDNSGIIVFES